VTTAETRRNLALIRQYWGDLLAAIDTDPQPVWPPQRLTTEMWARRDAEAAVERAERSSDALGDSPAPLNLDAAQAVDDLTTEILALADQVAAACQRPPIQPPRIHDGTKGGAQLAAGLRAAADLDRTDPRRWHYNASWARGVHWGAVYIDGRLADDDLGDGLFRPIPPQLARDVAIIADHAARRILSVLGIGTLSTVIPDRPCPWCGAELRLHHPVDEPPTVTCSTGRSCTAPVGLDDRGRRFWAWHDLAQLATALDAAERRATPTTQNGHHR